MDYDQNIDNVFQEDYVKAQELLECPDRVERLLRRLEKKLSNLPVLNDTLAYIPRMGLLVRSYLKREYTEIPLGVLVSVIGALLYFVSPVDLAPDFIPGLGYLDDAAVVGSALALVRSDIDDYMEWRLRVGLDW